MVAPAGGCFSLFNALLVSAESVVVLAKVKACWGLLVFVTAWRSLLGHVSSCYACACKGLVVKLAQCLLINPCERFEYISVLRSAR